MLLHFEKYNCLNAGHGNNRVSYEMGGAFIGKTIKEKDLEVNKIADIAVSDQYRIAANNQIIGMIRRNITYKEKGLIVPL